MEIRLIQQVNPSRIFFTAVLQNASNYFPHANYIHTLYHPVGVSSTIFKLNSPDGFLPTPQMLGLTSANEIIVAEFSLSILHENFSFASSSTGFQIYTPVEVKKGYLAFPLVPTSQAHFPVQTPFSSLPMFGHPPPIQPPRLILNASETSLPWNPQQQQYTGEQADHIRNIRETLGNQQGRNNRSTTRQPRTSHQPSRNRNPSQPPQHQDGPVLGNLFQPRNNPDTNFSTDGARATSMPASSSSSTSTTTDTPSFPRMTVHLPHMYGPRDAF